MSDTKDLQDAPQFQTAEFADQPLKGFCSACRQPIHGSFYRINGSNTCSTCSQQALNAGVKDSHAAFSRAILFGLGGAILGLILYSAVGILLNIEIGYVSLAVGYLVGKAMMKGSDNVGGRRYQIAAVLLTYAAVSLSAVPIALSHSSHAKAHIAHTQAQRSNEADSSATAADSAQPAADVAQPTDSPAASDGSAAIAQPNAASSPNAEAAPAPSPAYMAGRLFGTLVVIGLTSPFLELMDSPLQGAIGIIILLVGVRIAWRITAGTNTPAVEGPF